MTLMPPPFSHLSNTTHHRPHKVSALAIFATTLLTAFSSIIQASTASDSITSTERAVYSPEQIGISLSNDAQLQPRHHLFTTNDEAWITEIGTRLFRDNDEDGYFAGFSLNIDADTRYSYTEVHAVIDIQRAFGPREFLHRTSSFSLYGDTFSDEYRVEIELARNFPAGEFNLFIDLVDSNSSRVLDRVSSSEFSNLYALPLESEDFDRDPNASPGAQLNPQNDDVRVVEFSSGSSGILLLLLMGAARFIRSRLHKTAGDTFGETDQETSTSR